MEIFGISAAKLLLLLTIAIVLFGPDKVPEMMAQVGKVIRDFRRFTREMTQEFNEATGDLRDEFATVALDLKGELEQTQADLRHQLDLTGVFGETGGVTAMPQGNVSLANGAHAGGTTPASQSMTDEPEPSQAPPEVPVSVDAISVLDPASASAPVIEQRMMQALRTNSTADRHASRPLTSIGQSRSRVVGRSVAASRYLRRPGAHCPRPAPPVRHVLISRHVAGDADGARARCEQIAAD